MMNDAETPEFEPETLSEQNGLWPQPDELPMVNALPGPHPALLTTEELQRQCRFQAMKKGGPGGQHRNKVSSAVRLIHEATGTVGEASERRDQSQNLSVAIQRLRLKLAINYRAARSTNSVAIPEFRLRWTGTNLRISDGNHDHAAVLALLLDDLHHAGAQPSLVAPIWQTSTSAIVRFIAAIPPAMVLLNQWRDHHHRRPLKP